MVKEEQLLKRALGGWCMGEFSVQRNQSITPFCPNQFMAVPEHEKRTCSLEVMRLAYLVDFFLVFMVISRIGTNNCPGSVLVLRGGGYFYIFLRSKR